MQTSTHGANPLQLNKSGKIEALKDYISLLKGLNMNDAAARLQLYQKEINSAITAQEIAFLTKPQIAKMLFSFICNRNIAAINPKDWHANHYLNQVAVLLGLQRNQYHSIKRLARRAQSAATPTVTHLSAIVPI